MSEVQRVRFIDLFAGIGGFRLGFETACALLGLNSECVFTSEIKESAIDIYTKNFPDSVIKGDITKTEVSEIPDFDVLLAGFPCQAFSAAGKREGFLDSRGTLFFEIERILRAKRPHGFILENVEGLVTHDRDNLTSKTGRTLSTILQILSDIGYLVDWRVLNAADFGIPQNRKRIFIVGTLDRRVSLDGFPTTKTTLNAVLETGLPPLNTDFTRSLEAKFSRDELQGKAIKDKRGGENNIHSWDLGLKGDVSQEQVDLLNSILRARRNKKWAEAKGIEWMDGMPLTVDEIRTFFDSPNLELMLTDLVDKGYLSYEHPKDVVTTRINGALRKVRVPKVTIDKGFNIVTGKLSFEINLILDPNGLCPTLVATDLSRIAVCDDDGLRTLSDRELLRLSGFPDSFELTGDFAKKADVIGNTVVVGVVAKVAQRLLESIYLGIDHADKPKQLSMFE